MNTRTEHGEQSALFDWAKAQECVHPELGLLVAIPNGGHRHIATARRLKAEGVKAGVPDIALFAARGDWHGLFIEMKVGRNTPSDKQQAMLEALNAQGYAAVVAYSFEQARDVIENYLRDGLRVKETK